MTGYELQSILNKYDKPPTHSNKSEVFSLYYRVTGKTANRSCLNCAIECFLEMKYLAKDYADKEIPVSLQKQSGKMESINPNLTKYRVNKPFRVFGDPKIYNNQTTTDKDVEFLLNYNSALAVHFEVIQPEVEEVEPIIETVFEPESEETEPVKKTRKKRIAENG